ncbi:MAG: radical SAM protein [Selenomonadaceae bacterium]|nr:radical SAM protein [Selenomonadaceae bacterium]
MNVALVDIDSHNFPNLVLMKLSAWHKARGDNVFLLNPTEFLQGANLFTPYDKVYGACVFTENAKLAKDIEDAGGIVAGSGTGKKDILPEEIEHIFPDYSLYGISDTAYGFLTRGCPRNCPFCIVSKKEGKESRKVADLSEWWAGQKYIKLPDPNLLAAKEADYILEQLRDSGAYIDFTQGLDARLLDDNKIELLSKMKIKRLHFAWDNPRDAKTPIALKIFAEQVMKRKTDYVKYKVYVLANYWSSHQEDLSRIYWLRDNGYDPYVMIYDKINAPKRTRYLQRYVNNKRIFRTIDTFEEYDHKMK